MVNINTFKSTSTALEILLASILITTSLIGIISNILAFCYFKKTSPRSHNGVFFKKLYQIIIVTDLVICLSSFASVEALFSENRQGLLLTNHVFCRGWLIFWWVVSQNSIILITTLSGSRLYVLRRVQCKLKLYLPYLIPVVSSLYCFGVIGLLAGLKMLDVQYLPQYLTCALLMFDPSLPDSQIIPTQTFWIFMGIMIGVNIMTSTSFFIICSTFITTIVHLKNTVTRSSNICGSTKRHFEAAKTVVIVTIVYLVFIIPAMAIFAKMTIKMFMMDLEKLTVKALVEVILTKPIGDNYYLNNYLPPITNIMFVIMNSMVNPIVYFTRISGMRRFVLELFGYRQNQINPTSTENTGTRETAEL